LRSHILRLLVLLRKPLFATAKRQLPRTLDEIEKILDKKIIILYDYFSLFNIRKGVSHNGFY